MALFQKTIIKKHTQDLNSQKVDDAFILFQAYFSNPIIQENIREAKEEQFQEGFLRELFGNILGYTLNPNPNFNLTTELKNTSNSKKADGAILIGNKAVAVIELKGTDTTDLSKIETQAFGYKNNQSHCTYVITSNFEKLRFYIDNAIEFIEFNLFTLNREDFNLLWLCISLKSIEQNIPKKIKDESVSKEDTITKQLYQDYSNFKKAIFNSLVDRNKQFDKLLLFKKTQKLLDRFLFIFFAEDRLLLPANLIVSINSEWKKLQDMRVEQHLYERYKLYFNDLNTGNAKQDIYSYNGGLFVPDEILDKVAIEDEILYNHTQKLSNYDFQSEVDVNILGHIFENSLNEIEQITSELEGQAVDTTKTKRKKDGVFYTPKYITKYIVENTIGKLCAEKKVSIQLIEEQYTNDKRKTIKVKKELLDKLTDYRNWLLQLTICDPACGSGAFLNQALEFLITEHRYIDELQAKLLGASLILSDIENSILENNLFGVDINDESVEIAQLSLWLRTAQRNRKLNSLNNNIKCGNSLIDDPAIAGTKAFNWQKEFPQVFAKGGFDVVIGNPPYVTRGIPDIIKKALNSKFVTAQYQVDLYIAFIEKGISILKDVSEISFIVPNSWLKNLMMSECRKFILNNLSLTDIIPSLENVFPDASVDTMIFVGSKHQNIDQINISEFTNSTIKLKHQINKARILSNEGLVFDVEVSERVLPIMLKMKTNTFSIESLFDIIRGINPYDSYTGQTKEIIEERAYHSNYKKDSTFVPELKGKHTSRYLYDWDNKHFISYGNWLAAPREIKYFEGERIIFREILGKTLVSTLITEDFKIDRSLYIAKLLDSKKDSFDVKYILGILNSTLLAYYFRFSNNEFDNLFPKIRVAEFKKLPIKNISLLEQQPLITKVELMLSANKELNDIMQKFQRTLQRKFELEDLPKKLEGWYLLSYKEFVKELSKKKIKLALSDEAEWEDYFLQETKKAQELKSKIDATDKEIDQMVYKLYDLTGDEIKIVETK